MKREVNVRWFRVSLLALLLGMLSGLVCGCAADENDRSFQAEQVKTAEESPMFKDEAARREHQVAQRAKEIAGTVDGVTETAAVAIDQELSVAVDVTQMKRFQLKKIRKEIFDRLQEAYPEYQLHVSTDRKILSDLKKLEGRVAQQRTEQEKIELQKINEAMKG